MNPIPSLKAHLRTIKGEEAKQAFARRCGTTVNHLRAIAYGAKPCGESLAINLERESEGNVKVEELCPGVDWAVVRKGAPPSPAQPDSIGGDVA